jgi:hypothetical protein
MTLFNRILPSTDNPILRKAALATAGLAVAGGAVAGPLATTTAAYAAPAPAAANAEAKPAAGKELNVRYQAQSTYYYCGPAAVRNALTAQGHDIGQHDLAKQMGTTVNGTDSAEDTTKTLNKVTGAEKYRTTTIGARPSGEDVNKFKTNVTQALDAERAIVANVAGTVTDTDGNRHSFPGGHYVAIVGYSDSGDKVKIADSADPNQASYWVAAGDMANWIATRGYSH